MPSPRASSPPEPPPEPSAPPPAPSGARPAPGRARLVGVLLLACALGTFPLARDRVRGAAVLRHFAEDDAAAGSRAEEAEVPLPGGAHARARLYLPTKPALGRPRGVVLVHGVHHLGLEEPRLGRFARALAAEGLVVLTPEVRSLAEYRLDAEAIEVLGASVEALHRRTGSRAGMLGMSFAGGLALLTAADPRFAPHVGFVVAVGAHEDVDRVGRYLVSGESTYPDGSPFRLKAHDYGALVLVHARAEAFFPPEQVPAARAAVAAWLHEDFAAAKAAIAALPEPSRATVEAVTSGDPSRYRAPLLAALAATKDAPRVSPHGRLAGLRAPTFLLHGTGDAVVPASETAWLAREVPRGALARTLVSPAIRHVEPVAPQLVDQARLVDFMGAVLAAADALPP